MANPRSRTFVYGMQGRTSHVASDSPAHVIIGVQPGTGRTKAIAGRCRRSAYADVQGKSNG
jgi:hypothetical protein